MTPIPHMMELNDVAQRQNTKGISGNDVYF